MNCQQFENLLSDYLDETLRLSLRRQSAEHLIECQPCRRLLDNVRSVLRLCGQLGPVESPVDLPERILRATAAGEMMSCAVFDDLILDYVDGFITASEFHIFEAHFETCPRCQRLLKSIQLARELCQEVKSVEVPDGLHERIMSATTGAERRADKHRHEALQRVALKMGSSLRRLIKPVLTPELVTAVLLCLATVGLLLVDFSDDMSLPGVYRQARWQIGEAFHQRGAIASGQEKVASNLKEVKTQLGSVIETGIALFSKPPEAVSPAASKPDHDQGRPEHQSVPSTRKTTGSEVMGASPHSQRPEAR